MKNGGIIVTEGQGDSLPRKSGDKRVYSDTLGFPNGYHSMPE
jgi:hypothetical protein